MIRRARRLRSVVAAVRAGRELSSHDEWSPGRLAAHSRERALQMIRHAAERSPFYRERFAGIELSADLDLSSLPTIDKATMLDEFDRLVTDPRLRLSTLEAHLEELEGRADDAMLFGEYRAMASGGTSGRRGVFVYGREDWARVLAGFMRWSSDYLGQPPRLPRRRRLAAVTADHPLHMTGRMGRSTDVGLHDMLRLDARSPVGELVEALNRHRPEGLVGYASVVALLAAEQLAGKLRIEPAVVATTSEVRTAEMEEAIVAAWGRRPFNAYASTETGFIAADCEHHAGLHVFSDLVHLEVVDDDGRPVPAEEPGSRVLVTNLVNRTQPLIRFELGDLLTLSADRCPCGRPHPLLSAIDGRSDDVLELPAVGGGTVSLHPVALRAPLAAVSMLREYRVIHEPGALRVEAVLAGGDDAASEEIERRLRSTLGERGIEPPRIVVQHVDEIPRHPHSGKRRLVESRA